MSIWWSLHLRREAASVPLARRLLMGTMETAGVDPDVSYELSVALTEACANAVEHGGAGAAPGPGAAAGAYRVTAYLDGETCRIEVADSGPGFPRAETRAEAGADTGAAPGVESGSRGGGRPGAARPVAPSDAEHGRGLRLIEELADHVQFGNRSARGGAVVSFDKILKWKDTPSLLMA
ncbi:ATP-binding protein [Streptomyces venezuelae]|uniref:ATP-binding protein n=1 Tax=Streptomyces venezuelae TaxID=54571 RepID=UPI00123D4E03|nr:ATP-binding protein [Streptomyces venezuelae]QES14067.1 ATP-binding protein [Streptomyces venezuelae]